MDTKEYLVKSIIELESIKAKLKSEVIELDDKVLFQGFGIYQPQYKFTEIDQYKTRLSDVRSKQRELIKSGKATISHINWKVNGSENEGRKFIAESCKQMLRNFNIECDLCISKVKFSNYENIKERILQAYELQNDLNQTNKIEITWDYYELKIEELNLAFEYQEKKKEEQEELRIKRELLREEQRVAKEIEEKRKEYEKEQAHYQNAVKKIEEQLSVEQDMDRKELLIARHKDLENNLIDVDKALQDLDYREANQRAGYVYVISNIGAFGEGIYKIGMTRRLEPEDRISELSGAAVPFRYDIHAMIFSDDAPKLEAALHNAFADKKVNLVNGRKEFFRVSLDEIKKVVQENHDKTVDFINLPDAEQYRTSEMIRIKKHKK